MIKNLCLFVMFVFCSCVSSHAYAEIQYEISDIGTLQTHSSQAIALNNQGQILGWYNIDGSMGGKHFFLRDEDGGFHEIPHRIATGRLEINWRFLTDEGKLYGTFEEKDKFPTLFMWDHDNGVANLGILPGKEISAINNAGQVLIKGVEENVSGKKIVRPVIWQNGTITRLSGLRGDLGIESETSYGFDMNNKGEVVGQSIAYLVYKNEVYKQMHATKWVDGHAIDLHKTVPKSSASCAIAMNDKGDILIKGETLHLFIHEENTISSRYIPEWFQKINNTYMSGGNSDVIMDKNNRMIASIGMINPKLIEDFDSIWMKVTRIISANESGATIAEGQTIFGEKHAMLIIPFD